MTPRSLTACLALSAGSCALAQSTPIYVDDTAPPGGDGLSWATAHSDLYDALDAARKRGAGQQVWVAEGVYVTDREDDSGVEAFELPLGVSLLGGFPDGGGPLLSRDPGAHLTVLTGDVRGDDTDEAATWIDNAAVTLIAGAEAGQVIDGVTIEHGRTNVHIRSGELSLRRVVIHKCRGGSGVAGSGDALRIESSRLRHNVSTSAGGAISTNAAVVVTDSLFEGNQGVRWGGAVFAAPGDAQVRFERCVFRDNRVAGGGADAEGGAIFASWRHGAIVDCRFEGNSAEAGAGVARGGAVARFQGRIEGAAFAHNDADEGGAAFDVAFVTASQFKSNRAERDGGAVFGVAFAVDESDFDANSAGGAGGAIARVTFVHASRFRDNSASQGGAISGVGDIRVSEFMRNRAGGDGGAVFLAASSIDSTVFLANAAGGVGGAIARLEGDLRHSTVAMNMGGANAGVQATSTDARVLDSILWGNRDAAGMREDLESMQLGGEPIVSRSIIEGLERFTGAENLGDDPLFRDPVGVDGVERSGDEDLSLRMGSPAIDSALSVGAALASGRLDVRGFPRATALGRASIDGVSDRGALEAQDADRDGVIDIDSARQQAIGDCNRDGLADRASAGSLRMVRHSRIAPADADSGARFGHALSVVSGGLASMHFTEDGDGVIEIVRPTHAGWRFVERIEPRSDESVDGWRRGVFAGSGGWIAVVAMNGVDLLHRRGGRWRHAQRLDLDLPPSSVGVALRGDVLAVSTNAGVEIHRRIRGVWMHEQTIDATYAGAGIALAGDHVAVHAYQGAEQVVSIYAWNDTLWTHTATLHSPHVGGFIASLQAMAGGLIVGIDASGWPVVFRRSRGVWTAGELLQGRETPTFGSSVAIRRGRVLVADALPSELVEWRRDGDAWVIESRSLAPVSFAPSTTGSVVATATFIAVGEPTEQNFGTSTGAVLVYEPRVRDANGDLRPDECPACPPDFTRDGIIDGADLGALLEGWGSRDARLDLSADGVVNVDDLSLLMQAWGVCP